MPSTQPCVAMIADGLYAYGDNAAECRLAFNCQIKGASPAMVRSMTERVRYVRVTVDQASEICEMLEANVIRWGPL